MTHASPEPGLAQRLAAASRRIAAADVRMFDSVAARHDPIGDVVLPRLTHAADHSKLWFAIAAALAATRRRRPRRAAARGVGSIAVSSLLANQVGKRLWPRARPSLAGVPLWRIARRVPTSGSFPSGHTASAAAFAVGASLEMPELAVPLGALAAAVGYSRVYTGVHYPGDVMAGAAVGATAAYLGAKLVPAASVRPGQLGEAEAVSEPPRPTGAGVVAVINPSAGKDTGAELIALLKEELPDARIVELGDHDDLPAALRAAAADAEVLCVGGGDGTVNAGAAVALESGLPLLALPGGTFNHLARDLGLRTPADAIGALRDGEAVRIDVGEVDGEIFLNTASLGSYASFVAARERHEIQLGKPFAAVLAARVVLRHEQPLAVTVDGVPRKAAMLFVGNGQYEPRGFTPQWRTRLDDGRLDIRMLDVSGRLPITRFVLSVLTGRLARSKQYVELDRQEITLGLPEGAQRLARDGEVTELAPGRSELTFRVRPRALTIFRPADVRL